ncbi:major facilitator superfamily transporter [Boeremia exigua]|uniref:major facilitator superfamily transporter n=1 Tax=Boeremia exigua TaxID=749465 RepID=UPI001E8CB411|nr:major facilitator superfamily transporter [Boeremia exigua]KAH6639156.1 major facilitator superfamily transporter [Boeremia exigua]
MSSLSSCDGLDCQARVRRVNRKIDIALLPILSILYLFNGLDRSNVGNAETQGFSTDIGATPDDLNLAVSLFFVTFVLLQPLSAGVGRWLGAKHWITMMMLGWGTFTVAHAFTRGKASLLTLRLLVGAFEAGFFPTAVIYLSTFYCSYDLAVRIALFYGQYAVAGAFSGSIAYGIFHIKTSTLYNWQLLFVIEGELTILLGVISWFWLPRGPEEAWFLCESDRQYVATRVLSDITTSSCDTDASTKPKLSKRDVKETIKDWKLWYVLVFNICASVPSQAFSVFLPLVVQGLGYSSLQANLMSVPPYVCGATILYLFALSSDYRRERGCHIIGGISIMLVGLLITTLCTSTRARYAGLCILLSGSYVHGPLTTAWLIGNTPEPGKRALVLGVNGFGNLAGVIGGQLYKHRYAPEYRLPFYITLGFVATALLGYTSYRFTLQAVNKRRAKILASKDVAQIEQERTDDVRYADRKWTFQYGV